MARKFSRIDEIASLITEDPDVPSDQAHDRHKRQRQKRYDKKLPNSLVGPDVAGGIIGRIIGELEKLGCSLEDHEIEWMGNGFKINIWEITCDSPEGQQEIRQLLKKDLPESGWDMGRYPGRYAYAAIAPTIKKFAGQEFNVNIAQTGFKSSDTIEIVVTPNLEAQEPETDEMEAEGMGDEGMGDELGQGPMGPEGAAPGLGGEPVSGEDLEDVTLGLDDLEGIEGLGGGEEPEEVPPERGRGRKRQAPEPMF